MTGVDPATRTVTLAGGERFAGDALVLAAGSQPNFFRTAGAAEHALPLYTLDDATRLRSRILERVRGGRPRPAPIDQGALKFVVVGGGPTGVELAGALADLIAETMTRRVPRPRGQRGADPSSSTTATTLLGAVLRPRARLRRQGARGARACGCTSASP